MARNSKCPNCGYKFRNDDRDICPSCLSPRDDIEDCNDVHSHDEIDNISFVNEDVTFTEEPAPQVAPQPSNTYRPIVTPADIKIDYASKKKNKSCATIAIVYIVIIIIISIISIIAGFISAANSDKTTSSRNPTYSVFVPDITVPDISLPDIPDISMPDILLPDQSTADTPAIDSDYEYLGNQGCAFDVILHGLTAEYKLTDPKYTSSKDKVSVIMVITNNNEDEIVISSSDFAPTLSTYSSDLGRDIYYDLITSAKSTTIEPGKSTTFKLEYDVENANSTKFEFNALDYEFDSDGNVLGYYLTSLTFID